LKANSSVSDSHRFSLRPYSDSMSRKSDNLLRRAGHRTYRAVSRAVSLITRMQLPDGLSSSLLRRVCLEQLGEPAKVATAVRLSEQLFPGTFRLLIRTKGGRQWSIVYKAARYGSDHYFPAVGLPTTPGLPEYLFYTTPHADLDQYLPAVYVACELRRAESYRYLMEDLEDRYRPPLPTDLLSIVGQLPTLHTFIGAWASGKLDSLPTYDVRWSEGILEYARSGIEEYARQTTSETPTQVLRQWGAITRFYSERPQLRSIGGIHGDLKPSNLLVHRKLATQIKLVDWDGVGLGPAHNDLVALLAGSPPELVEEALRIYALRDGSLTLDEHRRMYEWCKLQAILLLASRAVRRNARRVEGSMWQLLFACMKLPHRE